MPTKKNGGQAVLAGLRSATTEKRRVKCPNVVKRLLKCVKNVNRAEATRRRRTGTRAGGTNRERRVETGLTILTQVNIVLTPSGQFSRGAGRAALIIQQKSRRRRLFLLACYLQMNKT
jgi:hypothetical protein